MGTDDWSFQPLKNAIYVPSPQMGKFGIQQYIFLQEGGDFESHV